MMRNTGVILSKWGYLLRMKRIRLHTDGRSRGGSSPGALRARRSRPPLTRTVSITFLNARFPGVLTMAKLSVNGLDELIDDLEEIARYGSPSPLKC